MGIFSILALLFILFYFGGWAIQAFIKYTVAVVVLVYGGIILIIAAIVKVLTRKKYDN